MERRGPLHRVKNEALDGQHTRSGVVTSWGWLTLGLGAISDWLELTTMHHSSIREIDKKITTAIEVTDGLTSTQLSDGCLKAATGTIPSAYGSSRNVTCREIEGNVSSEGQVTVRA